ncbi:MAG: hypothetical protein Q4G10_03545 [Bacteroidia bacterium]|nr:hypothetical protein [Bacteroidia bacterium]
MLYLLLAIVCATVFSVMFSICQKRQVDVNIAMLANYIAGALLSGISVFTQMTQSGIQDYSVLKPDMTVTALALVAGLIYSTGFLVRDAGTAHCGVSLTSICSRVSLIVPVFLSWLLLGDKEPSWLSVIMILISVGLISYKQESGGKMKLDIRGLAILSGLFLVYGICDFLLKYARNIIGGSGSGIEVRLSCFTALIFVFAALISLVLCFVKGAFKRSGHIGKDCLFGVFIGMVNIGNTSAILHALGHMPASYFYPIYNVCVVLACTLIGIVCLKERPSKVQTAGIILATISIVLYYVLG